MIYDLEEKTNQTIKPKLDYLETLPVRHFKTSQYAIGCVVDMVHEGYEDEMIMIVELEEPYKGMETDLEYEEKHLKAYFVCRGEKIVGSEMVKKITFNKMDEIIKLQKLYVRNLEGNEEIYFTIICER